MFLVEYIESFYEKLDEKLPKKMKLVEEMFNQRIKNILKKLKNH